MGQSAKKYIARVKRCIVTSRKARARWDKALRKATRGGKVDHVKLAAATKAYHKAMRSCPKGMR